MNAHRITLFLVVIVLVGASAVAQDAAVGKTPIHRSASEPAASADLQSTSTGGTSLIFLGVLLAAAIVIRRFVQKRTQSRTAHAPKAIKLLIRQQLDNELTIRLLQVGPRVLIVGSSPQGLTTLAELTDPEEIALLTGDSTPAGELFGGQSSLSESVMEPPSRPPQRRTSRIVTPTPTGA